MKCLCMTVEHTTINLTPVELTGQKPMQPLLGTEHYQCMDSLFIRGSIRHRSLHCHTGYETDRQQVNAVSHTTLPTVEQQKSGIMHGLLLCLLQQHCSNTEDLTIHTCLLSNWRFVYSQGKKKKRIQQWEPIPQYVFSNARKHNFQIKLTDLLFSFN